MCSHIILEGINFIFDMYKWVYIKYNIILEGLKNSEFKIFTRSDGDGDVGDIMMVTDCRWWWQNHYVGDFFRDVGDFLNVTIMY